MYMYFFSFSFINLNTGFFFVISVWTKFFHVCDLGNGTNKVLSFLQNLIKQARSGSWH